MAMANARTLDQSPLPSKRISPLQGGYMGKILRVDPKSGSSRLIAMGLRNPQGLHVDAEGRIWETEHGPFGGDELNLIREGANYGFPLVTYGADYGPDGYGTLEWHLSDTQARHDGWELPVYAWVPSLGISDLMSFSTDLFSLWKGDLIVGSLKAHHLYRIHIREGRAVVIEPIEVGERIRDLLELPSGEIVAWTDAGALVVLEPV